MLLGRVLCISSLRSEDLKFSDDALRHFSIQFILLLLFFFKWWESLFMILNSAGTITTALHHCITTRYIWSTSHKIANASSALYRQWVKLNLQVFLPLLLCTCYFPLFTSRGRCKNNTKETNHVSFITFPLQLLRPGGQFKKKVWFISCSDRWAWFRQG